MKIEVKRKMGYVTIKMPLRAARNLASILDYSGLNQAFEDQLPDVFRSTEIVADAMYEKLVDSGVRTFT